MGIRIGNAPVSWAVYEANGPHPSFERVLDAVSLTGYQGVELGPLGFMPTDPARLAEELDRRKLTLASSYLALPLEDPTERPTAIARALDVARLLASRGTEELIIADDEDAERMRYAGRADTAGAPRWNPKQWDEAKRTLRAVSQALYDELRMRVVVHPHAGTFIETPEEIDRLLSLTPVGYVDLCLDTAHCVYGGGDPMAVLAAHPHRVRYLHLKDIRADALRKVRDQKEGFRRGAGVFCAPGEGSIPFGQLVEALRRRRYQGWLVVEQDIVPDDVGRLTPDPFDSARRSREYLRREFDL